MKRTLLNSHILDCKSVIILILFSFIIYGCQQGRKESPETGRDKSVRKTTTLSDNWRFQIDIRNIGEEECWFKENFDRSSWAEVKVPQAWDCYEAALWGYEGTG